MSQKYRLITESLKKTPNAPGVYKFFDEDKRLLYVGKAVNLHNRVNQYFKKNNDLKTTVMVKLICYFDFILTNNELEALLLENNLINYNKPVFNIKLKDKKNYYYIVVDQQTKFARLFIAWHAPKFKGFKFGPFVSKYIATEVIDFLQDILQLRSCSDSFFNNRSRPCILYEIGKCSAPCVMPENNKDYQTRLLQAVDFLSGKNNNLRHFCLQQMQSNAQKKNYEKAAFYRDKIKCMEALNKPQNVMVDKGDYDIYVAQKNLDKVCVIKILVRQGKILDQQTIFIKTPLEQKTSACLANVIISNYLQCAFFNMQLPEQIIVSELVDDQDLIVKLIADKFNKQINIVLKRSGKLKKIVDLALYNAKSTLQINSYNKLQCLYDNTSIKKALNLQKVPVSIECFDISHFQGACTKASCVVFNANGVAKSKHRNYDIKLQQKADDYQAMYLAIIKRYSNKNNHVPDLILIDGGIGQLNIAAKALGDLNINYRDKLIAVSKGKARKQGEEKLHFISGDCLQLVNTDKALHYLQAVRDEAHSYAIKAHRKKMQKQSLASILENIVGIGAKKRQSLLNHFIDLNSLKRASIDELTKVEGVSAILAKNIYDYFH